MTKAKIIQDIDNYIGLLSRSQYGDYYIGITNDVERRLFTEHCVDKKNGRWIYCTADSDSIAREVEQHYLDKGMDGGPGGGDNTTKYVYCYKKTSATQP